ncbi:MAG: hypothetical protein F6K31_06155 [Symploca sp. SIO2G7]|nr:hypothetical protein [Symploca sp. SIO2G7]
MNCTKTLEIPDFFHPKKIAFTLMVQSGHVVWDTAYTTTKGFYALSPFDVSHSNIVKAGRIQSTPARKKHFCHVGGYGVTLIAGLLEVKEGSAIIQELFSMFGDTSLKQRNKIPGVYIELEVQREKYFCAALGLTPGVPSGSEEPIVAYMPWKSKDS